MNTQTLKYLALGILVGYLSPYLIALIKKQSASNTTTIGIASAYLHEKYQATK